LNNISDFPQFSKDTTTTNTEDQCASNIVLTLPDECLDGDEGYEAFIASAPKIKQIPDTNMKKAELEDSVSERIGCED